MIEIERTCYISQTWTGDHKDQRDLHSLAQLNELAKAC